MGRRPKNGENGSAFQRIDPAGRVVIPREYRKLLGSDEVWLLPSPRAVQHPHIQIWSPAYHDELVRELIAGQRGGNPSAPGLLSFIRMMARHRRIDDLGRVLLPKPFLEHAKIMDEVMVCGSLEVMIFARPVYEARADEVNANVKSDLWPM